MRPDEPIPIVIQIDAADRLFEEANALGNTLAMVEKKNLATAKKIGELLVHAKSQVAHGEWGEVLEKKCLAFSVHMARRYMRIYRHWGKVQDASGIMSAVEQLADVPDESESKTSATLDLKCPRCIRLGIARRDCEQCKEVQQEQRDREKGGTSTRPGRSPSGGGRSSGSSTAGTTRRPSPGEQAQLDWENRREEAAKVKQLIVRSRDAIYELEEVSAALFASSRAADFHELLRAHGVLPAVREINAMPIDQDTKLVELRTERTQYLPPLEALAEVFENLAEREKESS